MAIVAIVAILDARYMSMNGAHEPGNGRLAASATPDKIAGAKDRSCFVGGWRYAILAIGSC